MLRSNRKTIFLLLILSVAPLMLHYSRNKKNSLHSTPPRGKVHVLLLTSWRSGSSFMGQVFNHHPSVFFLYEPAWHVWNKMRTMGASMLRVAVRDLLWSIFKCDFSATESYLPKRHSVAHLFRWLESRALCSPPACPLMPRRHFGNITHCRKVCKVKGLKGVKDACDTYSHVVLKVVRALDLEAFDPLLQDPDLDLRIIHLVRDPRAVMRSRLRAAKNFYKDEPILMEQNEVPKDKVNLLILQEICRSHVRIYETAIQNPPPFLKGRYKMVRFEDVARHSTEEINDLFQFIGLEMSTELKEWLYNMTNGKGVPPKSFEISPRNASMVSQAWRTRLSHKNAQNIQRVCEKAMSLLGYRFVNNVEEQRSLHIDLLVPKTLVQLTAS